MREALEEARKASLEGEVPVGAVLVHQGEIVARAHNQVEGDLDATSHAEMLCIKRGSALLDNWRLTEATLYCTLEPCTMCAGALHLARIKRLVWGAPDVRQGAHGSWINLLETPHPIHQYAVTAHILAEECGDVLKNFFKRRRDGSLI